MDGFRFDALTRWLASGITRRRIAASGPLAALGLFVAEHQPTSAACKKVGKKCKNNRDCCAGAKCKNKRKCQCKSGFSKCNKRCYDLSRDASHCGACETTCASGDCRDGVCACGSGNVCPDSCTCLLSVSGFVCTGPTLTETPCQSNSDCQPGGACLVLDGGYRCTEPCVN